MPSAVVEEAANGESLGGEPCVEHTIQLHSDEA